KSRLEYFIGYLCCKCCWAHSCNRTKAYFESRNFFSVLRWDPVDVPGQTLLYSVQFNLYGTPYEPVTWCQNISTPVCDMTEVMTHVMSDVTSKYHVKVSSSGQCLGEVVFTPFWQTTLAAPQLSVTSNQTHLNVTVLPQMTAWSCSIENISFWGKAFQRPSVKYTVRLTLPESLVYEDTSRSVFIWLVETDEQYCGDVIYTLTHPGRSSPSENASFCVTVSAPNSWFHILIWPGLIALLLLIILPITLCQLSFKKMHSLPKVLVSDCVIFKLEPQAVFEPQKSESMVNEPSYASQEHCDREWTRNQPDVPVQDSRESSVHYSMCLSNQISSDDTTDETSSDSFGPESFLTLLISNTENSSGPLVVPVRSAKNAEGTPLLSDHVQNNSSYVSDVVTSNYRQNSLPEIPPEGQREQRTYIMRTDHLQDTAEPDESFINEEEPRIDVIFLDRCMVEIQGLSLPCN
uniref:Interferon lambda receptor 1 n=1 Tax=Cyprinus carpio TaxID=7962 RepID=A0A8C1SNR6_CYPCA